MLHKVLMNCSVPWTSSQFFNFWNSLTLAPKGRVLFSRIPPCEGTPERTLSSSILFLSFLLPLEMPHASVHSLLPVPGNLSVRTFDVHLEAHALPCITIADEMNSSGWGLKDSVVHFSIHGCQDSRLAIIRTTRYVKDENNIRYCVWQDWM